MTTYILNIESTFFLSLLQPTYLIPILYPGASGSLFFEITNISKLLERFQNICNNYQISNIKKIHRLY